LQISHQRARIHFTRAHVVDLEAPEKARSPWQFPNPDYLSSVTFLAIPRAVGKMGLEQLLELGVAAGFLPSAVCCSALARAWPLQRFVGTVSCGGSGLTTVKGVVRF
jgi:hypothetical protein